MVNKCGVVNCKGNYNDINKCRVFKIPKNEEERKKWLNVLPPRENFSIDPDKFFVCEKHWPADHETVKIPGGTRPANPPSIFDVPASCLPTPKPSPRRSIQEDRQLEYFLKKDKIPSMEHFHPEKELKEKYVNVVITRSADRFVCVFMAEGFSDCKLTVVVENKQTMCSTLVLYAYKSGVKVPFGKKTTTYSGKQEPLLTVVKRCKFAWFGNVSRHDSLAKTVIHGTVEGGRRRGRQRKAWADNAKE
ncbi:hypothetical protein ACOMHN_022308 [Nucella lapillus]